MIIWHVRWLFLILNNKEKYKKKISQYYPICHSVYLLLKHRCICWFLVMPFYLPILTVCTVFLLVNVWMYQQHFLLHLIYILNFFLYLFSRCILSFILESEFLWWRFWLIFFFFTNFLVINYSLSVYISFQDRAKEFL